GPLGLDEPAGALDADGGEGGVDQAEVLVEDHDPQDGDGDAADDGGEVEDGAEEGHAPDALVEEQGEQEGDDEAEADGADAEVEGVPEGGEEERVGEHALVVGEADELGVGEGG